MSTPDTFRDALAAVSMDHAGSNDAGEWSYFQRDADAVLASDEMQAIRRYIRRETEPQTWLTLAERNDRWRALLAVQFGPAVASWVLDDPSPDSPADKPCETCGDWGKLPIYVLGSVQGSSPCPSCRGGEHQ